MSVCYRLQKKNQELYHQYATEIILLVGLQDDRHVLGLRQLPRQDQDQELYHQYTTEIILLVGLLQDRYMQMLHRHVQMLQYVLGL